MKRSGYPVGHIDIHYLFNQGDASGITKTKTKLGSGIVHAGFIFCEQNNLND